MNAYRPMGAELKSTIRDWMQECRGKERHDALRDVLHLVDKLEKRKL